MFMKKHLPLMKTSALRSFVESGELSPDLLRVQLWGLVAICILILGSFIMILGGFLKAERFLEPSFINIANILLEQRQQPGIIEKSPDMKPECKCVSLF